MDARTGRLFDSIPGGIYVFHERAGERSYRHAGDDRRNLSYRLEVAWRSDGETGLNDIHAERLELPRHPDLLLYVH